MNNKQTVIVTTKVSKTFETAKKKEAIFTDRLLQLINKAVMSEFKS